MTDNQIQTSDTNPSESPSRFSWRRLAKMLIAGLVIFILVCLGYVAVTSSPVKAAWANLVYNRREHYLDCEHLPFNAEVEKVFNKHPDIVSQVKATGADFEPEKISCKIYNGGLEFIKGDALLTYKNRSQRTEAEKIIGKDFYGMAYRGKQVK